MAKTPLVLEARDRLRLLGDQLYYLSFADGLVQSAAKEKDPDALTADAFPAIPHARGINVRVRNLDIFGSAVLTTGYGAIGTASYEVCASYFGELTKLLASHGVASSIEASNDVLEERLRACFESIGIGVDRERYETLKYLRLRRNQIAHLRDEPANELRELIRTRGTYLMRYWDYSGGLDFAKQPTPQINMHETVGILRFTRILVDDFDAEAGASLNISKVIAELNQSILESQPHLRGKAGHERRAKKICTLLDLLYGRLFEPEEIRDLVPEN